MCPVGGELFQGTNGGRNPMELIVAFRSFANAPKNHQISAMGGLSVLPDFATSSSVSFCFFLFGLRGIRLNPVKAKPTYCSIGPQWDCVGSLLAVATNKRLNLSPQRPLETNPIHSRPSATAIARGQVKMVQWSLDGEV